MGVSCSLWGLIKRLTKIFLLSELAEIGFDQILPFMLGGDFNLSRFPSEKNKELEINRQNDVFNYVINLYELRELVMIGGTFMWWNNHKEPTLEKLDRVLVLKSWDKFFLCRWCKR
jgi:hypothetical protein